MCYGTQKANHFRTKAKKVACYRERVFCCPWGGFGLPLKYEGSV